MTTDSPLFRLFNEIAIISQLSSSMLERMLPEGMTIAQFIVLNHFVRLGGERSPAALAEAFQVTRATMTSTLHKLEAKGFVSIRPDEYDGRAKKVALTPAGAAMRTRCVARMDPALGRLGGLIDGATVEHLLPALADLRRVLDKDRETASP
jgi:DNA-binding MarR family transcriptional regulator